MALNTSDPAFIERHVLPFQGILDPVLLHQLVDWSRDAGPGTVIKILQQLVGVEVDGVLGPQTLDKVNVRNTTTIFGHEVPGSVALNLVVRDARVMHYAATAKRRPQDLKFLLGWLHRTLEFK